MGTSQTETGSEDDGVIPRAVRRLFETVGQKGGAYQVHVSFLEVHNEEIRSFYDDICVYFNYPFLKPLFFGPGI